MQDDVVRQISAKLQALQVVVTAIGRSMPIEAQQRAKDMVQQTILHAALEPPMTDETELAIRRLIATAFE